MSVEGSVRPRSAFCVVLGNEKGGSGKSTVAMHIAVALLKAGQRVATIDLDSRQKSFTHYIENRKAWAKHARLDLELPSHYCIERTEGALVSDNESSEFKDFAAAVDAIEHTHDFIVIDTPGHDSYLMRLAHSMADTLITPLNDSFVDFDVLGTVDPVTFAVTGNKPLLRHGARGAPPAPRGGSCDDRLDRGAQSLVDAWLAQQAPGRRGASGAFAAAWLPCRGWLRRARDLPRILSARPDRARQARRRIRSARARACRT